jgi:hypothetical protein
MNVGTDFDGSMGFGFDAFWTDGEGVRVTMSQSGQALRIISSSWVRERLPTRSNIFS